MKIDNYNVYDLKESIIASGLPFCINYDADAFAKAVSANGNDVNAMDISRAYKLAQNNPGTGHNNFLSGILVSANVTATNAWWLQMERYHFVQIVAMQSKMHRLARMDVAKICNIATTVSTLQTAEKVQSCFKNDENAFEQMVYSMPLGLQQTARITTNYLSLKTIWMQRHLHKLQEWRDFCKWIAKLPLADSFIIPSEGGEEE